MRKLLLYFMLCVTMFACNDSEDDGIDGGVNGIKNKFRVKEINGENDYWGKFSMSFTYYEERVDSALVRNAVGDTIAILTVSEDEKSRTYYIADVIPAIDPDSIQKLEDLYGDLAKDSIPMMTRNLFTLKTEYTKSVMTAQEFNYYRPREDVGTGPSFNNKYLNDKRMRYIYEYDASGRLKICRMFSDVFEPDPDDNVEFKRLVYKAVFAYDEAGKTVAIDWYQGDESYEATGSYRLTDRYQFVYSGEKPSALNGKLLQLTYQYAGDLLTSIDNNGATVKYGYNNDGYLNRIEKGTNDYMDIKYQSGNGNFSLFTPLLDQGFGVPYIR